MTFDGGGCVAFRGPTASQALFYAVDGESLFVASRISAIRAVRAAAVDVTGLAPFLVPAMCAPTGTAWHGIHRLPPGHLLTWSAGKVEVAEVAHITPVDSTGATTKDLTYEVRSRLTTAVRRSSAPPDGLLLSGGIDSSSLACAYAFDRHLTSPARAYALTYDRQLAACDERRFLDDVERVTTMPVHRLPGNRLLPLVAGYPEDDEPEPWPYASRNWALLRHTAADLESRTATLLAGEGGDELLLGQVFSVADRIARGDTTGGADELRTFPDATAAGRVVDALLAGSYDTPGARLARATQDVPPWLSSTFVADAHVVPRLADGYPRLGRAGGIATRYSRALVAETGAAGRVQCGGWSRQMAQRVGIHLTYPFLDPDLAALVWSLPPQLLRDRGREKAVLRDALADLLPPSVYQRTDKAEALALLHAGLRQSIEAVRAVARGPLADLHVVHPDRLLTAVDRYLAGDLQLAPALWATVSVDRWLTHQDKPLGIGEPDRD